MTAKIKVMTPLMVPNQEIGNTRLNVMPFQHNQKEPILPIEYSKWEETLKEMLKYIPLQKNATQHYITICSDFFTESGTQRREGVHMDGNFCVDPDFVTKQNTIKMGWGTVPSWGKMQPTLLSSWGGISPKPEPIQTWGGMSIKEYCEKPDNSHVKMDWVLPYSIVIPIAKYVSSTKGGLLVVSSDVGTKAWKGEFKCEVAAEGSFENMIEQLTPDKEIYIPKNTLVAMSSNTPHETLHIEAGTRRTFMRITLNHNYDNTELLRS